MPKYLGKLILSSSLDGTVRLWDIATASVLHTFKPTNNAGVNVIKLSSCPWLNSSNQPSKEDPECDLTRNKLLVLGTTDGMVYGFDVFERKLIFSVHLYNNIGIKSLDVSIDLQKIWIGLENGVIGVLSLKADFDINVESFYRRTQAPMIISHQPCKNLPNLWLCSTDGSCALWSLEDNHILKELAVGSSQTSWTYGFQDNHFVSAGSSGIIYMIKTR